LESDDADWDGYMAWLEADPRHREAFDSIALVSAAVDENRDEISDLMEAQRPQRTARRVWPALWLVGCGIAAAFALFVIVPALRSPDQTVTYASKTGESRTVALANGTSVTLSPASRIVVHGEDASRIDLASGEAYFDVRHDPSRTLTVQAGNYKITDIGTRFSVNISDKNFRVGVSEGTISVTSIDSGHEVQVSAGHQLTSWSKSLTLAPFAPAQVASWRSGRLSYDDAPLALVAADISRYSGKQILVDPSLQSEHFSGTLIIGDGSRLVSDLATIMAVDAREEGGRIRIGARRR
jgi:transmembrane sensor